MLESIVDIVNNNPESTWVAIEYPKSVITTAMIRARAGLLEVEQNEWDYLPNQALPEHFDAREKWPNILVPVRNQGSCGSCWAHAVSEVAGNKLNIAGCSRGVLSVQDLVSCDKIDRGCNGGLPPTSWSHVKSKGITTEDCLPYVSGNGRVPQCPTKCMNGSEIIRVKAKSYKHVSGKDMQQEIYENGPIESGFLVYEDLKHYKSGIYKHTTGKFLGAHAVMVMGWGVENGTPYWIVQNSWGEYWGERGFFRIIRGSNDCQFELACYTGTMQC
eukprot:MONOS_672.1-p1 / transcript=MONOS_672.1 / gene=MONOS_672 / organism=Monocercomonoides_exilis_PA203 / gene_product=cathepsin B5 cysteine protease / transcript_product=cathepsin B5 cysteine protease / location=Mono_scaffold00011:115719-116537(+) / protein_length=272 / sequence_SO=supercontig / SO=protein_coding / is_pseudo=false